MAAKTRPVPCGLNACYKLLQCPGLLAMAMRGWVCRGCAHGPDSWQKVPRVAQLKSQPILCVGGSCEGLEF